MKNDRSRNPDRSAPDSPVYWFARYESAILRADIALAQLAKCRLSRLGYAVSHHRGRRTKGGAR